ncbi:MORN repeat-containing protein [Croceivirga sp. JEA036]|uniref:MORN repeat-containing protein n=1 Tax=Croceivirga sp. JEA036 TaxID=2721162 RepID=UPI0014388768|nr:hypothetical protein [Croceivirga sp. JEA036]NJB35686.1 hypothetical protein [Croceivirga sp. JEA036]
MEKISKRALGIVAGVGVVAAIYFIVKTYNLTQKLEEETATTTELENALNERDAYLTIDSMVVMGDYDSAIKAYSDQLATGSKTYDKDLRMRIALTQKLRSLGGSSIHPKRDSLKAELDSLKELPTIATSDIRAVDSLAFALQKVKVQVSRLQEQLKNRSQGEYLKFKSKKGNLLHYVGQVDQGKANGYGIALLETGSRYEGQWLNNQRHGQGAFYWIDGEYYIGAYKEDKRSGEGTYFWPNGEKYVGQWKEDKRNGKGVFYSEKGKVVTSGVWRNDKLVSPDKKKEK